MILNYVNESIEPKLNFTCKCGKKWLIIVGEDKRREKDEM